MDTNMDYTNPIEVDMVKIGLVGFGFMGGMHAQCYSAGGEATIAAVADIEADRREKAKRLLDCAVYSDIDTMLAEAKVDAVDICTPTYLHEGHVVAAARAGKDILCEKPMALTLESCDTMIRAVEKAGVKMMVGHVIRFWPEHQVVKRIVALGEYGRVLWVSARRFSAPPDWAWKAWLADPARSGGAVHDLHIHDQDFIAYLIGSPKRVHARGAHGLGGGIDSVLSLGWEHESGASSYAEGSLMMAPGYPFTMALTVSCDRATIEIDSRADPSLVVYLQSGERLVPELPEAEIGASAESGGNISDLGGYYNEIKYFTGCIRDGKKPTIVTPESAREAVRICLAVRESAETGRAISL